MKKYKVVCAYMSAEWGGGEVGEFKVYKEEVGEELVRRGLVVEEVGEIEVVEVVEKGKKKIGKNN